MHVMLWMKFNLCSEVIFNTKNPFPQLFDWLIVSNQIKVVIHNLQEFTENQLVVYFNQQMGTLHAVCWLKSSFWTLFHVFPLFAYQTGKKCEKLIENTWQRGSTSIKVLLLNAGWYLDAGWLLKKILKYFNFVIFQWILCARDSMKRNKVVT